MKNIVPLIEKPIRKIKTGLRCPHCRGYIQEIETKTYKWLECSKCKQVQVKRESL